MTQHTPEKVSDLIATALTWNPAECAASPVGAWHMIERLTDALEAVSAERDTLLGPDSDDRDELITAPIIRALQVAKAERDALQTKEREAWNIAKVRLDAYTDATREMHARGNRIIADLESASVERDEALAVIAEARAHEWSNYGDSETHRILSRIPEHPKED